MSSQFTWRPASPGEQHENKILAALRKNSREWVQALEPVRLQAGMVLYEPDETIEHVYFLNSALVSIISTSSDGSTVEIGLVGNEGIVGVPAILGGVTRTVQSCKWKETLFALGGSESMMNSGATLVSAI